VRRDNAIGIFTAVQTRLLGVRIGHDILKFH